MRLGATGERELVSVRWGLAGKDDTAPTHLKHMHARSQTNDTLDRRCNRGGGDPHPRYGAREATAIGNGFKLDVVSAAGGVAHMMRIAGCFV